MTRHPFAVEVHFVEREGQEYPVVSVPSGVRTPVAAKSDLCDAKGRPLIKDHAVYVRSLSSNNTVSSTEARRGDWERLVRICFDNREADIGGFVRRHLAGVGLEKFARLLGTAGEFWVTLPSIVERVKEILDIGRGRFDPSVNQRGINVPQLGYREAAILIDGEVPSNSATESFLNRLFVAKPRHTGWSPWLDSRGAREEEDQPYVFEGGWEAFVIDLVGGPLLPPHLDFWRIDPGGRFYHLRALEDDLDGRRRGIQPGTQLDFLLQVSRLAEVISIGLSFGRSMGCDESKTSIVFAFRWTGLEGRLLTSWVNPDRSFRSRGRANQHQIVTTVAVPLETPLSGLAPYVEAAVKDLFALFGGMEFETRVIEGIVKESLSHRF